MTIDSITTKVRGILNEIGEEFTLDLVSDDTVKLDDYIRSVIPDAVMLISRLKECPSRYLYVGNSVESVSTDKTDGCTIIKLPKDFLRVLAIRLDGWRREVQTIEPYGGETYKEQHYPITRAGTNKPVCVYANDAESDTIECFPGGDVLYFRYVRSLSEVTDDALGNLSGQLFQSICYMCAYLVYSIFESPTTADRMKQIAIEMIPADGI